MNEAEYHRALRLPDRLADHRRRMTDLCLTPWHKRDSRWRERMLRNIAKHRRLLEQAAAIGLRIEG